MQRAVAALRSAGCVFAEQEAELLVSASRDAAGLAVLLERRCAGLPLEHVLGWADFCGLRISVAAGVFVPRRRTGFLVRQAAARIAADARRSVVVDLCCGSGAVGAALAATLEGAELHAVDLDPAAVRCARANLRASGGRAYAGDLYEPLPGRLRGRVDLLVANAPYVPTDAIALMPPEARVHEPRIALDGGADGLDVQRRVIAAAALWLAPDGHLLLETSERQAAGTLAACEQQHLAARLERSEELDATVVVARGPRRSRRGDRGDQVARSVRSALGAQQQLEGVKRLADEDVTLLGEQLQRLGRSEVEGKELDEATRLDYQSALDAYESARRTVAPWRRPARRPARAGCRDRVGSTSRRRRTARAAG